jgi:hypothetical protein
MKNRDKLDKLIEAMEKDDMDAIKTAVAEAIEVGLLGLGLSKSGKTLTLILNVEKEGKIMNNTQIMKQGGELIMQLEMEEIEEQFGVCEECGGEYVYLLIDGEVIGGECNDCDSMW